MTTNKLPPHIPLPVLPMPTADELLRDGRSPDGRVIELSPDLAGVAMVSPELAPLLLQLNPLLSRRALLLGAIQTASTNEANGEVAVDALVAERFELERNLADDKVHTATSSDLVGLLATEVIVASDSATIYRTDHKSAVAAALRNRSLSSVALATVASKRESTSASTARAEKRLREIDMTIAIRGATTESSTTAGEVAQRELDSVNAAIAPLELRADELRKTAAVTGTDLTGVTLDAYWRASKRAVAEGCKLPWQLLAAIGRAETNHGTGTGGRILGTGQMTKADIGVALDGGPGVQRIVDSDGGVWDGDPVYDRAFGAMQFIPWSWARFGRDGNGDSITDPNNVYDGALTAVSYVCRFGPDITSLSAVRNVIFKYNAANWYVDRVVGFMAPYVAASIPDTPGAPAPELAAPTASSGSGASSGATSQTSPSGTSGGDAGSIGPTGQSGASGSTDNTSPTDVSTTGTTTSPVSDGTTTTSESQIDSGSITSTTATTTATTLSPPGTIAGA